MLAISARLAWTGSATLQQAGWSGSVDPFTTARAFCLKVICRALRAPWITQATRSGQVLFHVRRLPTRRYGSFRDQLGN